MFNMIKGAKIPVSASIIESYEVKNDGIYANVSAERIRSVLDAFIDANKGKRLFLFIEVPTNLVNLDVEEPVDVDGVGVIHQDYRDVYYMDDISADVVTGLLNVFDEVLINDGLSSFGIGTQDGDEIGKLQYNVMNILSAKGTYDNYVHIFANLGMKKVDDVITAWTFFSEDNPGVSERYVLDDGRDIYTIIEILSQNGMYLAERRDEDGNNILLGRPEYYCTKCGAILEEQEGFDPDAPSWICHKCNEYLINDKYTGDFFGNVLWYCDECGDLLNSQEGFTETEPIWKCTKCSHDNKINQENIFPAPKVLM